MVSQLDELGHELAARGLGPVDVAAIMVELQGHLGLLHAALMVAVLASATVWASSKLLQVQPRQRSPETLR